MKDVHKNSSFRKDGELLIVDDHLIKAHLHVEHTWSGQDQYMGLRFRNSLPWNAGMTFLLEYNVGCYMVMDDTYIPLDMVFFDSSNYIKHIEANVPPLYPHTITPPVFECNVLEVNAGFCQANKITLGDRVLFNIHKFRVDDDFSERVHLKYSI